MFSTHQIEETKERTIVVRRQRFDQEPLYLNPSDRKKERKEQLPYEGNVAVCLSSRTPTSPPVARPPRQRRRRSLLRPPVHQGDAVAGLSSCRTSTRAATSDVQVLYPLCFVDSFTYGVFILLITNY